MDITYQTVQQIFDEVGNLRGWDFSPVQIEYAPMPWSYVDVVKTYMRPSDHILDIGTGGGELFLTLAPYFKSAIAIDSWPAQIETALKNQTEKQVSNVEFMNMEAANLNFEDESFDLVLNSHCGVYAEPIARVLRPDGYFITEQVGRRINLNLLEAFGWTPESYGPDWWWSLPDILSQFREAGCRIIATGEFEVPCWFRDLRSLIFYLKAIPLPEEFNPEKDWQAVKKIVETYGTNRGIESTEHSELLIAQKLV